MIFGLLSLLVFIVSVYLYEKGVNLQIKETILNEKEKNIKEMYIQSTKDARQVNINLQRQTNALWIAIWDIIYYLDKWGEDKVRSSEVRGIEITRQGVIFRLGGWAGKLDDGSIFKTKEEAEKWAQACIYQEIEKLQSKLK